MLVPRLRSFTLLALLLALAASVGLAVVQHTSARADAVNGRVWGPIVGSQGGTPKVTVKVFDADWTYLRQVSSHDGAYSISLEPGTYYLQFVDRRPAYDVKKYAPTDVKVTVKSDTSTFRSAHLQVGGYLYGTVSTKSGVGKKALIKAANAFGQTYETRANSAGEFALGGLPASTYWVYTYDHQNTWVGKVETVRHVQRGHGYGVHPRLATRAGRLLIGVTAGGKQVTNVAATIVNKSTGQFWTANARNGLFSFSGLYPGRYTIDVQGWGSYLEQKGDVRGGRVRPGKISTGQFTMTKRGGDVAGRITDGSRPGVALAHVQVLLYDANGTQIGGATTGSDGTFVVGGRLTTQNGVTLVAQPDPDFAGGYLDTVSGRCRFDRSQSAAFRVTTGEQYELGDVALPRSATTTPNDPCGSPAPSSTASPSSSPSSTRSSTPSSTGSPSASAS